MDVIKFQDRKCCGVYNIKHKKGQCRTNPKTGYEVQENIKLLSFVEKINFSYSSLSLSVSLSVTDEAAKKEDEHPC